MLNLRRFIWWLAISALFACSAEAQSRLNFPRVLSAGELATTGIALVNTSSASVVATFNFYGLDGILVGQAPLTVPAKGQVAKLAKEILSSVTVSTWIQISSSSSELQGFELVGDFSTVVDGAGPAAEGTNLALIDFSREDTVHIVNANSQPANVQITLNNAAGVVLGATSVQLAAFQPASVRLGDVNDDDNIDLVSITANVAISASLTTKLPGGADIGVTNAVPASGAPSELFLPFVPNGPQGGSNWNTLLGVANLAAASQTVSLTLTPEAGSPVTIQRNLAPGGSVGDSVQKLFSLSASAFTTAWIRITGTGPLSAAAAYQDSANGSLAIVPSQSSGATRFYFGHIASLPPWYTGIALLNTSSTAANVEVFAIDGLGQLIGSQASFSLATGARRTALLSELIPQVLQRQTDGGFVFIRTSNNVPLLGFELFGHSVFPILANVQGFALPSASAFTPPGGGTSGSSVNLDQVTFSDGTNSKTQFAPRDTIVYVAAVTNSTGAAASTQITFSVKDPNGRTMLTTSTSAALPAGSGSIRFSSSIPSNALTGKYAVTGSLAYQGATTSKSANFDVGGGSSTPTAGQENPFSASTSDLLQVAFRPGDTIRFVLQTASFLEQEISAVVNYQLTGPGALNAASGSVSFSVPTGLATKAVDVVVPASAPFGLYAFASTFTAGGASATKGTVITVVPKSSSESIDIDTVFITDADGVPKAGLSPGGTANVFMSRVSSFPLPVPATARYLVTGPNSSTVLDQSTVVSLSSGPSTGSATITLPASSAKGTYIFQPTLTYLDNGNAAKTSTLSTTFNVDTNVPTLTPAVNARPGLVMDINLVTRTAFSPGESLLLFRRALSTFPAPLAGTVRYQITGLGSTLLDSTFNVTFTPGMNTSFIPVTTSIGIPARTYTFTMTATAQGQTSTTSTTFTISGGSAPPLNFGLTSQDEKPGPTQEYPVQLLIPDTPADFIDYSKQQKP